MSKYQADIEIAVKGAQELTRVTNLVNKLSTSLNAVNKLASINVGESLKTANIENYVTTLKEAEDAEVRLARAIRLRRREMGITPPSQTRAPGGGGAGGGGGTGGGGGAGGGGGLGRRAESIALGVGFPLMFGAGPATLAGSLAGSFMGSGFGGQILLGGLGQKLDELGQTAIATATAMRDPITNFDKLREANILASKSQEFYIQKLIEAGYTAEATAVIQSEVIKKVGVSGANDLNNLAKANEKFGKVIADTSLQLQVALAGPLKGLLEWATNIAAQAGAGLNEMNRRSAIEQGLSPAARKELEQRKQKLTQTTSPLTLSQEVTKLYNEYQSRVKQQSIQGTVLDPATQAKADEIRQKRIDDYLQIQKNKEQELSDARLQYERQIADFRENTLRRIADMERNLQDQRTKADFDLQQSQLKSTNLSRYASATENIIATSASGGELKMLTAIRDGQKIVNDAALSRRQIEFDSTQRKIQLERALTDFKRETERGIGEMQKNYARQTEGILTKAGRTLGELMIKGAQDAAKILEAANAGGNNGGGGGPAVGGAAGLSQAIERIRGATSFRGTTLAKNKRPGDYQSSPNENFFFDFQSRAVIDKAKKRVTTLTKGDIAALALTVLTEAGPTAIGKMDVAANLITRSAMAGNDRISNIATAPGQYEGIFSRGLTAKQLEDPAVGRRIFGSAYTNLYNKFSGQAAPGGQVASPAAPVLPPAANAIRPFAAPSTAKLDKLTAGLISTEEQTKVNNALNAQKDITNELLTSQEQMKALALSGLNSARQKNALDQATLDLIKNGITPELAAQLATNQQSVNLITQELEAAQAKVQITLTEKGLTDEQRIARENIVLAYDALIAKQPQVLASLDEELRKSQAIATEQERLNAAKERMKGLIQGIGGAIESGLVNGIEAAVTGAQSLQDVMTGVLKDIGKMLISFGIRSLLGGINIGGTPLVGKAAGGPVAGGTPYVVGEKGPELFVPGASGTIIPNDAMSRYQRQNSSAGAANGGTGAAGDGSPASWAMNFETTQFLGQDWVSKDQLMAAMAATEKRATAAGAKAGAQQVATKMRTSPAFRRQVGI
jgi:hypothetical protein